MKIGVNGAYGQLGTLLRRELDAAPLVADVRDDNAVELEIRKNDPDVVVHCAAIVGTLQCDLARDAAVSVNVHGTENVAQACLKHGVRMVYLSTTAVYDPDGSRPYVEDGDVDPWTYYGKTKHAGEVLVRAMLPKELRLILRPCFAYGGPGDRWSNVANMIRAAVRGQHWISQLDPKFLKDWLHADDFARITRRLIENDEAWGRTINVAHGRATTFRDVLALLGERNLLPPYLYVIPEDDYLRDHVVSNDAMHSLVHADGDPPLISLPLGVALIEEEARRELA